jgi:hypothetical protein
MYEMICLRTSFILLAIATMSLVAGAEETRTFRQGLSSYAGAADATLSKQFSEYNYGGSTTIVVQDVGPDPFRSVILRFADLFGAGSGQIPYGQTIYRAT